MKKALLSLFVIILMVGCGARQISVPPSFPPTAVKLAHDHGVAIAVYYFMGEEEYNRRIEEFKKRSPRIPHYLETVIPLGKVAYLLNSQGNDYALAYLGAGGIIGKDHVLTVRHLFVHDAGATASRIWVMQRDAMLSIEATLVATSVGAKPLDDYAVCKLSTPLGLPGLKLARVEPAEGEPIVFVGSTGGLAFHTRYGWLSRASRYFGADSEGYLHLAWWDEFEYVMVYPGGPGDSGGIILNAHGELVGLMYCGIEVYSEQYIFANPIVLARDFLAANKMEHLGQ